MSTFASRTRPNTARRAKLVISVHNHQHTPAGQPAAVQGRAFLHLGGDRASVDAQGPQAPTQDLRRIQR